MNRFDEFKQAKTPTSWINGVVANNVKSSNKVKIIKIKYILVIISIVIALAVSTLGVAYAIYEPFRDWLTKQLGENMEIAEIIAILDKKVQVENQFIGTVDDDYNYTKLYIVENGNLVECKIKKFEGKIEDQTYSFRYASYNNRIIGFDYQGCVIDILPMIIDNDIYVCVDFDDRILNDIVTINMETKNYEFITDDHISVNPIVSPQQMNILINKNDQRWENYNLSTKKSSIISNIDKYQHNNCITFIDENTVITYDSDGNGILVDITTDTTKPLKKYPLEGSIVNIEEIDGKIKFTNVINNQECSMNYINSFGTYCSLDYVVLFDDKNIYVYDILNNKILDLNPKIDLDEKIDGVRIINNKYLLIITDNRAYVIANEENSS